MISTKKCSAYVANSRWLVVSAFLLIMTTSAAIGESNARDNKPVTDSQSNGASNDDSQVSAHRQTSLTADPMDCVDSSTYSWQIILIYCGSHFGRCFKRRADELQCSATIVYHFVVHSTFSEWMTFTRVSLTCVCALGRSVLCKQADDICLFQHSSLYLCLFRRWDSHRRK